VGGAAEGGEAAAAAAAIARERSFEGGSKVRLSAKERRRLKKLGLSAADAAAAPPPPPQPKQRGAKADGRPKPAPKEPKALPRGKKSKLKKMKAKYAEQDEDDRKMAMIALGVMKAEPDEAASEAAKPGAAAAAAVAAASSGGPLSAAEVHAATAAAAAAAEEHELEIKREQWDTKAAQEARDVAQLLKDEGVKMLPEDAQVDQLDRLTGKPHADDILRHCVPVCAPYCALLSYKYKVKLTPGTQKKGRAAKMAKEALCREASQKSAGVARERELMSCMQDAEMVAAMVGEVRLASASARQVQASAKSGKKAKKKTAGKNKSLR